MRLLQLITILAFTALALSRSREKQRGGHRKALKAKILLGESLFGANQGKCEAKDA